jgi:NAD+ synthase
MTTSLSGDRQLAMDISAWLREQLTAADAERFVFGLSGGIDSAVVCALCCQAIGPAGVIAAIMPAHSASQDAADARLVATAFGVTPLRLDLTPVVDAFLGAMRPATPSPGSDETAERLAIANVKPRLRMTTLYYLANRFQGLVVGTGNKTEARLGYFTKYGDGGVDLLPIVDLSKGEVRALAAAVGVPAAIITKAPSAGLWPGQTDEGELGARYAALEAMLAALERGEPTGDPPLRARVAALERASAHKREPIPAFRRT